MKKIWQIDRRTFLRGFGAAVGLPMLDIMAPSLAHAQIATPKTRRLVWIYIPHGYIASAAKPDYLMNLHGDMRPNVSVVHGLRNEYPAVSQNGHFSIWAPFLNGVPTKNPAAVQTTFDQRIAAGQPAGSKVATLSINVEPADQVHDFNVQQANNPSFKGPNQPVPALSNPLDAYNRLFAGGAPVQADQRMAEQLKRRRGILHYTLEDSKKLMSKGSASDRIRLEEYFQGLSELDQRLLTQLGGGGGGAACTPPAGVTNSANYGTRLQMFYDIAFFANLCDLTRVTTFMHAPENNAIVNQAFVPGVQVGAGWHAHSHYGPENAGMNGGDGPANSTDASVNQSDLQKIIVWHYGKALEFARRLRGVKLPTGATLLDESLVAWGSSLADSNSHESNGLLWHLAGTGNGSFKAGVDVDAGGSKISNLWLTLMQGFGVSASSLGDGTQPIVALRA